ncbi:hypothetical protein GGR51DRAFT_577267 [Nemania sp. FL0031]|nr:hypothetical protein GGR51DRAFT_577267 [Nemania sp. FL0031]
MQLLWKLSRLFVCKPDWSQHWYSWLTGLFSRSSAFSRGKKEGERFAALQVRHATAIRNQIVDIKKTNLNEDEHIIQSLQISRDTGLATRILPFPCWRARPNDPTDGKGPLGQHPPRHRRVYQGQPVNVLVQGMRDGQRQRSGSLEPYRPGNRLGSCSLIRPYLGRHERVDHGHRRRHQCPLLLGLHSHASCQHGTQIQERAVFREGLPRDPPPPGRVLLGTLPATVSSAWTTCGWISSSSRRTWTPRTTTTKSPRPCPYSGINATLRLMGHYYRISPTAGASQADGYAAQDRAAFRTDNVPISVTAISSGIHSAGVFEPDFPGATYQPFGGRGCVVVEVGPARGDVKSPAASLNLGNLKDRLPYWSRQQPKYRVHEIIWAPESSKLVETLGVSGVSAPGSNDKKVSSLERCTVKTWSNLDKVTSLEGSRGRELTLPAKVLSDKMVPNVYMLMRYIFK